MLNKLIVFKNKFEKAFYSRSHAIILESEDPFLLNGVSTLFCMNLFCENGKKICFECANCKKILDGNCLDVITFDKTIMVEDVEKIIDTLNIVPAENEYKVYIINNFELASERVQNKLLKSLEEPPKFVKFVLLVKNSMSLLPTILSRCEKIVLPQFSKEEILNLCGNSFESGLTLKSVSNCGGNIGTALNYLNNPNFTKIFNLCLDTLLNMTSSEKLLEYSSKIINNKENFNLYLNLLENLLEDIMFINNNCLELVKNNVILEELKMCSNNFSNLALIKIIQYIDSIKKKLSVNVNFNLIVDAMLLYILEVKHKCKK